MQKNKIVDIAKKIHINLSNEEIKVLENKLANIENAFDAISNITIPSNTIATTYPISTSCNSLREDVVIEIQEPNKFIKNAKNKKNGYVVIKNEI